MPKDCFTNEATSSGADVQRQRAGSQQPARERQQQTEDDAKCDQRANAIIRAGRQPQVARHARGAPSLLGEKRSGWGQGGQGHAQAPEVPPVTGVTRAPSG
jgi:hypothetical protein